MRKDDGGQWRNDVDDFLKDKTRLDNNQARAQLSPKTNNNNQE